MERQPTFELLSRRLYDGHRMDVPLQVGGTVREGLAQDTEPLLHAATLIGTKLKSGYLDGDISRLRDMIGGILKNDDYNQRFKAVGWSIEDDDGVGGVSVEKDITIVNVREVGQWHLPTSEFLEMLDWWADQQNGGLPKYTPHIQCT